MKKKTAFLLLLILTLLCSSFAFAHQGKTDSKGGHHDRKHGGYHYHHGYPAHSHTNGVCPYQKTTTSTTANPTANPTATPIAKPTTTPNRATPPARTNSPTYFAEYYASKYPSTWKYIQEHSDDPEAYVAYYHSVWGTLQLAHGDGMVLDELTNWQCDLIHYPELGETIFVDKNGVFHLTDKCYCLLEFDPKTDIIEVSLSLMDSFDACPACVPLHLRHTK